MVRRFFCGILSFVIIVICGGCRDVADKGGVDVGKLRVFASFFAVSEFVAMIGGDKIAMSTIVTGGGEPHDWEPSPKDFSAAESADVVFYNGGGMEPFIDKFRQSTPNVKYVELAVLPSFSSLFIPAEEIAADPHCWLSPNRAMHYVQNVFSALAELDPDNAEYYANNLSKAIERLTPLCKRAEKPTGGFVVVTHAAFGWFCGYYGLEQYALTSPFDEGEPTPAKMAEAIKFVKDNNITTIFCEAGGERKVAEALAKETGADVAELYTFEYDVDGLGYFDIMARNLAAVGISVEAAAGE